MLVCTVRVFLFVQKYDRIITTRQGVVLLFFVLLSNSIDSHFKKCYPVLR